MPDGSYEDKWLLNKYSCTHLIIANSSTNHLCIKKQSGKINQKKILVINLNVIYLYPLSNLPLHDTCQGIYEILFGGFKLRRRCQL